jgi:hypothetical protein
MYKENCSNHRQDIIDNFKPAELINSFFSQEEVEQILLLQFQSAHRIKWTDTSNNIQAVCDIDTLFKKMPVLDEKFKEVIGDYEDTHTGNYYITTKLHDAHVDLMTEDETERPEFHWAKNVIPYKSVVIPLLISSEADAWTAYFRQRHIGNSITLDRVGISSQLNSDYRIARQYPEFYTLGESINADDYIFPHIPKENLEGLEIESVFEFIPGSIMLFDSCQIHASCVTRKSPNYKWLKSGINIQFYRRIN